MRTLTNIKRFLILTFIISLANPVFSQRKIVAKLDSISKIEISKSYIKEYIQKFDFMEEMIVSDMLVSNHNGKYFLLVKCKINNDKVWIYIIELKSKRNKLLLRKSKVLNACESESLSIDIFNIVDGEAKGCIKCNHKIMKK